MHPRMIKVSAQPQGQEGRAGRRDRKCALGMVETPNGCHRVDVSAQLGHPAQGSNSGLGLDWSDLYAVAVG